jgi:hypothetical protein
MDYSLFRNVYEVKTFLAQVPVHVRNILPLPWKGGRSSFILDEKRLQIYLDDSANTRRSLVTPTVALNPSDSSNKPSPSVSLEEASTLEKQKDEGHVLLPFGQFVKWISSSMNCHHCRKTIQPHCIKKTTLGIATSLHFRCDSRMCASQKINTMEAETVTTATETQYTPFSVSRFACNWRLLQATQLIGESQKAGDIIAGFLDLAPLTFQKPWWKMENELSVHHTKLTKEIIFQNLKDAIKNLVPDENGWVRLTCSFDMGWQKPGRLYNSLSGHAFLICVLTRKVIAMRVLSKKCQKCTTYMAKGVMVEDVLAHNCSKNYDGSSKGMEATAALDMVKGVFENQKVRACVTKMVIDDDASTCALLSHSLSEMAQQVVNFEWPVDSKGKKHR